jgi:hypothetical protein
MQVNWMRGDSMRRWILMGTVIAGLLSALLPSPQVQAQQRAQLGPLCTSEDTPADKQIDACNKIMA